VAPYSIIRSGDWKLIRRYEGRRFELFDLRNDPSEKTDLADSRLDKVNDLDARLSAWVKKTGARMPMRDGAPVDSR
jgi:arylsulfatase A-like enzyme